MTGLTDLSKENFAVSKQTESISACEITTSSFSPLASEYEVGDVMSTIEHCERGV